MAEPEPVYASVDVETTGYSPRGHEIVEIAVVRFALCEPLADTPLLNSIVRPRRRVPNWRVHGITNRMVRGAPYFSEISGNIIDALSGSIVVCHNARFDLSFLEDAFHRLHVQWHVPHLCTLRLKDALGLDGSGGLADQCRRYSIEIPGAPHTALHDARATVALLRAMLVTVGLRQNLWVNKVANVPPRTPERQIQSGRPAAGDISWGVVRPSSIPA